MNDDIWGDDIEAPVPASIPHKKPVKRKKQKRAAPVPRDEAMVFVGITARDCPFDCKPKRCVITHTGHCGHPNKGALFSDEQMNPDIMKRWNAARKILAMSATANRFKDDE